ncbi:HAD-IA family hydrolase [Roseibacillus ishigakijimensis]|uniref:HAD-IA family hydrolase n=1 Tax=Roseibacillus ishigakijimensis TaxID=454146 RepID=A0A934RSV6_9BACT|nr:HAD-IA family hydrolase [Roseibacillus ishigakijimensis]MBK1833886.1 HAD-IA family hydrolase [Roseibacillus ishigakijimensis]
MPLEALFLDAAGTLFDLAEPVEETYARVGRQWGLTLCQTQLRDNFAQAFRSLPEPRYHDQWDGHASETAWWRDLVLTVTGLPDNQTFENYFNTLFANYERAEAWRLFPETVDFLSRARGRFRLAVVSNFDRRLHTILQELALTPYFECVITSAEARARKPNQKIFQHALSAMNLKANQVFHLGDSHQADFQGARLAGLASGLLSRQEGESLNTHWARLIAED